MNSLSENNNLSTLILKKFKTPSVFAFFVIILFTVTTFKFWVKWNEHPFDMDVDQYYSYIVAQLIHHDFSFSFPNRLWLIETPTGHFVPKVTMGLSFLYLPFFVIANNIAYAFNYDDLGYSPPYAWCIHFGAIIYVLIGIWYCRKSLLMFFNEWVVAISIILILFGSNLFYYTYRESEMAHSFLFFLFSIFIYHVLKWRQTSNVKYIYYFSFIAGLVTLIRPTEILILLFPLFIYVSNFVELKFRFNEILRLKWKLLVAIIIFCIPIIPQLIFWKIYTGQFLFFSYGSDEGFFFTDPKFYSVLIGWRKGWLIYSPIMIFSLFGLVLLFFKQKKLFFSIFIYFILNLYLISSWWDWGYGGAFGMRALVQCYAFLIIPFAFFVNWIFELGKKKVVRIGIQFVFLIVVGFFCHLNLFQMYQIKYQLMHWDSMTKEAYCYTFLNADGVDRAYLETLFVNPNYEEMRKGNRDE